EQLVEGRLRGRYMRVDLHRVARHVLMRARSAQHAGQQYQRDKTPAAAVAAPWESGKGGCVVDGRPAREGALCRTRQRRFAIVGQAAAPDDRDILPWDSALLTAGLPPT